jgi:hypothetical protein
MPTFAALPRHGNECRHSVLGHQLVRLLTGQMKKVIDCVYMSWPIATCNALSRLLPLCADCNRYSVLAHQLGQLLELPMSVRRLLEGADDFVTTAADVSGVGPVRAGRRGRGVSATNVGMFGLHRPRCQLGGLWGRQMFP